MSLSLSSLSLTIWRLNAKSSDGSTSANLLATMTRSSSERDRHSQSCFLDYFRMRVSGMSWFCKIHYLHSFLVVVWQQHDSVMYSRREGEVVEKTVRLLKGFSRQIIHAVIVTQSLRKRFTCSSCSSSSWLLPEIVSVVRVLNDFIQLLFYFYLHDLSWKLDRETKKDSLGNKFPRNHSANPFPSQGCQSSSLKVCNKIKRIWIFSFLPTQCQRIAMNCKTTDTLTDITEWWCLSFQFRDSHCLSFVHINLDTIRWRNACILSQCFFSFEDSILWSCLN